MGENLQDLRPREAESLYAASHVRPKAFYVVTRMAKWEIRFQRFAISFRPSALDVCCFRFPLAFSIQPLAFAIGANEKFYRFYTSLCDNPDRLVEGAAK